MPLTGTPHRRRLHIGHSPDPDDAFMWYPLARPAGEQSAPPPVDTGPYEFVHVLEDIQSLNERAEKGDLEITAFSMHQYPFVAERYALTSCGSSMGDGYGPMVVAPATGTSAKLTVDALRDLKIAIPGERTTAFLALQLLLGKDSFAYEPVMFDQIIPRVAGGEFDAGLIIHEGQLTYAAAGLECVVDLGRWWTQTRGLPLPLGANAIRRDLGDEMPAICAVLLDSIRYALAHRAEAVGYALNYARDMGHELADEFIGMYVNDWTLDYGERGRQAVRQLLREAADAGITPDCGEVDFIAPG